MVVSVTLIVLCAMCLAEWLHWRRWRRLRHLHQATRRQHRWTWALPLLRVACFTISAWAICILLQPHTSIGSQSTSTSERRLMILLDVSPSMHLIDAGPKHELSRAERARDLTLSLMERSDMSQLKTSIVAFYNGAKPVVIDTTDLEVVRNIVDDLPLDHAFTPGKTNIMDAVKTAADIMHPWPEDSTDVIVFSDGDSVPDQGLERLPGSCRKVIVVGVGSPRAGRFIDGHQSRQDTSTLRRLARRLRGVYHNGNEKHIPSVELRGLSVIRPPDEQTPWDLERIARAALVFCTSLLAAIPLLLHVAGSSSYRLEKHHA